MVDDSLNYPLAPLGLLIQDSPPSHKPLCHWLDRFFCFLFFIFCAESKDTRSPASQMSLLQSASLLQPHIRPTTNPPWTNKTRGFKLFAVFSFARRVFTPSGTYAPIPTVAALIHYLIQPGRLAASLFFLFLPLHLSI